MENYTKNGLQGYQELRLFIITCSSFYCIFHFSFSIFMVLCECGISRGIPLPCLPSFWFCTWYSWALKSCHQYYASGRNTIATFARAISLYWFYTLYTLLCFYNIIWMGKQFFSFGCILIWFYWVLEVFLSFYRILLVLLQSCRWIYKLN